MKKRLLSLLLAGAMALSLAACGGTPAQSQAPADNSTAPTDSSAPPRGRPR